MGRVFLLSCLSLPFFFTSASASSKSHKLEKEMTTEGVLSLMGRVCCLSFPLVFTSVSASFNCFTSWDKVDDY